MSTHHFFPIDLSEEEIAAGFRLVMSRVPMNSSEVVVAVKNLSPSARLIKFAGMGQFAGGYQLQYFFTDEHPFRQNHPQPPAWDSVGAGPATTIEHAIQRFRTEPLDPNFKLEVAPESPTVSHPNSDETCAT